jgi:hypothetical protein
MRTLTNSERSCFRRCHREHRYKYVDKIRPVKKGKPLDFGTVMHGGLEQWSLAYQDIGNGELLPGPGGELPLEVALSATKAKFVSVFDEDTELDEFDLVVAEELMKGYHFRWSEQMGEDGIEVIAVEQQFDGPLVNPETGRPSRTFRNGGKVDVIVRWRGEYWLMEHKTTSKDIEPGSDYWQRLRIDGQVSTYYEGAHALGFDVVGCIYDVIRKPTMKPYKATPEEKRKYKKDGTLYANQRPEDETPLQYRFRLREDIANNPMKYYSRGEVIRTDDDRREFMKDAWFDAKSISLAERLGAHPRNPDSCVRFNRFCPYFDVCTGVASLDDESRFRHTDVLHPELTD